jgi:hypothetical protein
MSFSLPSFSGTKVVLGKDKTFIPGKKPYEGELSVSNLSIFGNHPDAPNPNATVMIGSAADTGASRVVDIVGDSIQKGNQRHEGDIFHQGNSDHRGDFNVIGCFTVASPPQCRAQITGNLYLNGNAEITGNVVSATLNGASAGVLRAEIDYAVAQPAKPFDIPHPIKEGMRLRHVAIEGPEIAVYFRGKTNKKFIVIPDYWKGLVDYESITVSITPFGFKQNIWVTEIQNNKIFVESEQENIQYYYRVEAERIDMNQLIVEYEGESIHDYPDEWLTK